MSKPIILRHEQWYYLGRKLKEDYPESTFLLRNRMKEQLGFTIREHREDISLKPYACRTSIRLDFYDERKRTFFLLKYSDYITSK